MNLLNEIIEHKKAEVAEKRKSVPMETLLEKPLFRKSPVSLRNSLKKGNGLITEFKRKSPSAGKIKNHTLEDVLEIYRENKTSGLSVLTDEHYFGGSVQDLQKASNLDIAPILRKDFIVDEYQIFEAKAYGADAILLIAEALDEYHTTHLSVIARMLGLEVLMEFHSPDELHKLNENVDIVGVNNRNLKTLKTDLRASFEMIRRLPYDQFKIAESGISSSYEIRELLKVGYEGFLIGESILKDQSLLADFNSTISEFKKVDYAN